MCATPPSTRPAIIPTTETPALGKLFRWLARDPQHSWSLFKRGLMLFAVAASLILLGSQRWHWLQIPGLMILVVALGFAAWGYLGILAYRMTRAFRPPVPFDDKES